MKMKTTIAGAAGLAMLASFAVSAPAMADKLEDLKAQGFARVAIANEPPFTAVAADGKVSGAAPDVAREIFKRLGIDEIVASISEYGAMIPGLQAGRFDVVTAGLFMKPERCAAVVYSEPVLCDAEALLVKKGNPKGFQSYADIANSEGATVGAPVYCDGAAFKKGDEALRDAYDVELAKMKESGEFAKIIEPYGFSAAAAMSTSREKLCSQ